VTQTVIYPDGEVEVITNTTEQVVGIEITPTSLSGSRYNYQSQQINGEMVYDYRVVENSDTGLNGEMYQETSVESVEDGESHTEAWTSTGLSNPLFNQEKDREEIESENEYMF